MARLTIEQVISMRAALKWPGRWFPWRRVIFFLGILVLLFGLLGVAALRWAGDWPDQVRADLFRLIFCVGLAACLPIAHIILRAYVRAQARVAIHIGAACPGCGTRLNFPLVLASGRCGNCGAKILDHADLDAAPSWTHAQVATVLSGLPRILRRFLLVAGGVWAFEFIWIYALQGLKDWPDWALMLVAFGPLILGTLIGIAWSFFAEKKLLLRVLGILKLACPFCKADLRYPNPQMVGHVMASGRCYGCGQRLFVHRPDGEAAPPLQTRQQAFEAVEAASRQPISFLGMRVGHRAKLSVVAACPSCGRRAPLYGITLATGRCRHCGARVLADD
jgi:hypothetical protein